MKSVKHLAIRTITDIVVELNSDGMLMFVMVHFDRYTGPTIDGTSVPITPVEVEF